GAIRVPAHAPVSDINVVADPIHQLASAKVQVPPPIDVDAGLAIWHFGCRAEPAVIVQGCRRGADFKLRLVLDLVKPRGLAHLDGSDFADAPVPHQFAPPAKVLDRPLPTAGLPDAALALTLLDHGQAFAEVVRQRLLAVDILLGPRRLGGDNAVPMVGYRDAH